MAACLVLVIDMMMFKWFASPRSFIAKMVWVEVEREVRKNFQQTRSHHGGLVFFESPIAHPWLGCTLLSCHPNNFSMCPFHCGAVGSARSALWGEGRTPRHPPLLTPLASRVPDQGSSTSKPEHLARNPLLFGEPGETGILIGVYHDHNLTSSTARADELRDSLVAVSREFVDVYNHTGEPGGCVHSGVPLSGWSPLFEWQWGMER